ncbi:MAG TPA: glycosyltransferase family 4 protein, partial [Myxococcota bacterium]|nr:glycosyltransferase family 4 protein [Myxococcota bacterium]
EERRIHVIPPGLDGREILGAPAALVRSTARELGPGPWVLYAGNPDGYQNLALLWEAFACVRARRPDAKLLVVTHHPPASFGEPLARAPQRAGIVVRQHRSLDELRALFAVADVGVCTRALWVGTPIKVLNYIAAGLPVVACHAAARHILTPATGTLVEPMPEAFAAGVLAQLNATRRRPRRAPDRAFERFRVESHVGLYERAYRAVLH